ncbi:MAG: DNA-processing protein DprA [Planctomycetota bacterium]
MRDAESDASREFALGLDATGFAGLRELNRLEPGGGSGEAPEGDPGARAAAARLRRRLGGADLRAAGRAVLAACAEAGIEPVLHDDPRYPDRLRQLPNPPIALYLRGRAPGPAEPLIAIVGSRRASRYGRRVAAQFGRELSARGVGVVSGLARGVDTAAHEGSLVGPGRPFAVLGSGLRRPYPTENLELAERIAERGGLLSEFPPDVPPLARNFPRRNRIIAALATAVVVVEADERSGALITARWAAELGREVLALPGPVDSPTSRGTLALLRDGATLVRSVEDLVAEGLVAGAATDAPATPRDGRSATIPAGLDANDRRLLGLLDHEPATLDEILAGLDLPPGVALGRLLALELRGLVVKDESLRFRLALGEESAPARRGARSSVGEEPLHREVEDEADGDDGQGHVGEEPQ